MSLSRILIQAPALYLTSESGRSYSKQKKTITCCCPWSPSEPKKQELIDELAQNQRYEDAYSLENLNVGLRNPKPDSENRLCNNLLLSVSHLPFLPAIGFQFPSHFVAFLLSLSFFSLIIKRWKEVVNSPDSRKRLPPGPPKLPVIGHLHHFISSLPHQYPLRHLATKYGPLMHLKFGEVNVAVISSPAIAKEVLRTHDLACADRPKTVAAQIMWYNYSDVVFSPYGDYWKQMRKICILELLSLKNVRSFEYISEDEVSFLIEFIRSISGVPFNLTEKIFSAMSSMTCRAAFGSISKEDRDRAGELIKKAIGFAGHFNLADLFPSMKLFDLISWKKFALLKLHWKLDTILDNIIDAHREKRSMAGNCNGELDTEDLVDVLLRLKDTGELEIPITNDNIKSVILDMFAGGTETSSATVDWAMAELMRNPRVMLKAQAEIRETFNGKKAITQSEVRTLKYLKLVINETLRLHPPASLIPRASREEFKLNGYDIPKNTHVVINIWSIGRDPNYWHNPDCFEPERFEAKQ